MVTAVGHRNNFDALRIIAALSVLVSHAFAITRGPLTPQPLAIISRGQTDLGSVAVFVFFVISGYLVSQSFDRAPLPARFLAARCLRIFPALIVVVLASVLLLGPAMTVLPWSAYFADPDTMAYVLGNASLLSIHYALPGVFAANPVPSVVNGSLWTLPYEFLMYLAVLALGMTRLLRARAIVPIFLVLLVLDWRWLGGFYVRFATPFAAGALLYLLRDRLPLDSRLAALCAVLLLGGLLIGGFRLAFSMFGAYLVIYLAKSPRVRLPDLARYGDFSYGVYVVAYPVQQAVTQALGPSLPWYTNIAVSLPIVLGLAALSWHFVEKPALLLKSRVDLSLTSFPAWQRASSWVSR